MDFRNKYLVNTVRILLGLVFLLSGVAGLLVGQDTKGVPEAMVPAMKILWDTGILQMIKTTEAVAGLMLITGFLPALAAILIAPVCVGIVVFNARMMPQFVVVGVILGALTAYLGYAYWEKYAALFRRK